MDFFLISNDRNPTTNRLLETACRNQHVGFRLLNPEQVNFIKLPKPTPGDLVYRAVINDQSIVLEQYLLNEPVATLYRDRWFVTRMRYAHALLEKEGVPIPKTVSYVNRLHLDEYVLFVGGFPLIIKSMGGSHGVGVMRLDSRESLVSLLDHLDASGDYYIMREYIADATAGRLFVLGDRIVDSLEYPVPTGDFRSNATQQKHPVPREFPEAVRKSAITAVSALGLEFGGVDILFSGQRHYIVEVNFPCFFARPTSLPAVNIADRLVKYLAQKSRAIFT